MTIAPPGRRTTSTAHQEAAPPTFLTPEQLAELFTVPLETVYQWRRKHTGPPGFRVGRHLRYDLSAVLAWVAQQQQQE